MNDMPPEVMFPYRIAYWSVVVILMMVVLVGVVVFSLGGRPSSEGNAIADDFAEIFENTPTSDVSGPIFRTATALAEHPITPIASPIPDLPVAGGGGSGLLLPVQFRYRQLDERIILKEAYLQILVEDVDGSVTEITTLVESSGGWMVESSVSVLGKGTVNGKSAFLHARVPAEELDSVLEMLHELAIQVSDENIRSSDVTNEYVDLQSQLTNLEAAEEQLQAIMDDADDTEDVVSVFNQLTQIRGEIERIKGQLQFYDESVAYSSITLNLNPYIPEWTPSPAPTETGWSPSQTFQDATDSAMGSVQGGIDALIWGLVYSVMLIVIIGLPILLLMRWLVSK